MRLFLTQNLSCLPCTRSCQNVRRCLCLPGQEALCRQAVIRIQRSHIYTTGSDRVDWSTCRKCRAPKNCTRNDSLPEKLSIPNRDTSHYRQRTSSARAPVASDCFCISR